LKKSALSALIRDKKSFLCVGLDTEIGKLPDSVEKSTSGMVSFNKAIIDATAPYCVSYKINTAFYEQYGEAGWRAMEETLAYIPQGFFTIADAKRGDIGNTSTMYARAFLERMNFDAITVSPYMGNDSVLPFMKMEEKFVIVLGLTSNSGSMDLQMLPMQDGRLLYEHVVEIIVSWGDAESTMIVAGATRGEMLSIIRRYAPDHFLLVPGVGAQGGSLSEVVEYGMNDSVGLLVNSSRGIIYASSGTDYASAASREAHRLQQEMAQYL
jgi:orotidine-5'-phosphate decarboxylase